MPANGWSLASATIVLAAAIGGAEAHANTWSLASDFDIHANSQTSTWSYWTFKWTTPATYQLLTTNTRNANDVWGGVANPPLMWSDATGYWGIGKNTGATTATGSNGFTWAPGEVMSHPGPVPGTSFGDLAVCWLAPATTTIDVAATISRSMTGGNSVGYAVVHRSGGVDTTLVEFTENTTHITEAALGSSRSYARTNLPVSAGDRLFFRIDNWGDPSYDITRLSITITGPLSSLTWTGAAGSGWNTTAVNWKDDSGAAATFADGYQVVFNDTVGAGSKTLAISGSGVAPGTVSFNHSVDYVLQSSGGQGIIGRTSLAKSGSGTLTLSGGNNYTGGTVIGGGTLKFASDNPLPAAGSLPTAGAVQISGGAQLDLDTFSTAADALGAVTLVDGSITGTGGATLTAAGFAVQKGTISVILDGMSAGLTKTTAGTVVLSAPNTYGGPTDVQGGVLQCNADSIPGALSVSNNSTLDVRTTVLHTGPVTLTSGTIQGTAGATLAGYDYAVESGTISVNLGDQGGTPLVKSTSGKVILSGINSYTGGTEVSGGTLEIASIGALPAGQALSISAGGAVVLSSGLGAGASMAVVPTGASTAVPEPSTLLLLAAGAAVLLFVSGTLRVPLHRARRTGRVGRACESHRKQLQGGSDP